MTAIEQLTEFLRAESDAGKKTMVIVHGVESIADVKGLGVPYLDPETSPEETTLATAEFVDAPAGQSCQLLVHVDFFSGPSDAWAGAIVSARDAAQTVVPFGLGIPIPELIPEPQEPTIPVTF